MTVPTPTDRAAAVLAEHAWSSNRFGADCRCGWPSDLTAFESPLIQHRAHVAQAIAAAGLLVDAATERDAEGEWPCVDRLAGCPVRGSCPLHDDYAGVQALTPEADHYEAVQVTPFAEVTDDVTAEALGVHVDSYSDLEAERWEEGHVAGVTDYQRIYMTDLRPAEKLLRSVEMVERWTDNPYRDPDPTPPAATVTEDERADDCPAPCTHPSCTASCRREPDNAGGHSCEGAL